MTIVMNDLLTGLPLVEGRIDPMWRQEESRTGDGRVFVKDLGPMLWKSSYRTAKLPNAAAFDLETQIHALGGGIGHFLGWDIRRMTPASDNASALDSVTIHAINAARTTLRLAGLPANFTLTRGDYMSIDDGTNLILLKTLETVQADGAGISPEFTSVPEIAPSLATGQAVTMRFPSARFQVDRGSLTSQQHGLLHSTVSWTGTQVIL